LPGRDIRDNHERHGFRQATSSLSPPPRPQQTGASVSMRETTLDGAGEYAAATDGPGFPQDCRSVQCCAAHPFVTATRPETPLSGIRTN
jgi:hypothetical protein